ncbi:hypothetical protein ACF05T_26665 [Streptomyces lateritius]|uniref:Uncharacterized protein n=1 Tax=Streptomyces lateritius TaxID=67313 RepID=A0ABW6YJA5_9ACTN
MNTFAIEPPAIAASLPQPSRGTVAVEAMSWELRVGDVVPYDDCIGRAITDIHAVGPGHRARRLVLTGLPPLAVRHKLRVHRAVQRL